MYYIYGCKSCQALSILSAEELRVLGHNQGVRRDNTSSTRPRRSCLATQLTGELQVLGEQSAPRRDFNLRHGLGQLNHTCLHDIINKMWQLRYFIKALAQNSKSNVSRNSGSDGKKWSHGLRRNGTEGIVRWMGWCIPRD